MVDKLVLPPPATRLSVTYLPRDYLVRKVPQFVSTREEAMKALVYNLRYYSSRNELVGNAVMGPVEVHAQLAKAAGLGRYSFDLPHPTSHRSAALFSTGSLNTGDVETIQILEKPVPNCKEMRNKTIGKISLFGDRLAAATMQATIMVIEDRLDEHNPSGIYSSGPVEEYFSQFTHTKITHFQ